jgi:hypothetical protein
MKDKTLIFSWWLWVLSILYYMDIITYSPILPLTFGVLFATYTVCIQYAESYHWSKKIVIISLEIFFTSLAYFKNPMRALFNPSDLLTTLVLVADYILYLHIAGTNPYILYTKTIPESHRGETFFQHVKKLIGTK